MTTLEPDAPPLDESTYSFVSAFMSKVATVAGYGENRVATIGRAKALLLTALLPGDGAAPSAWAMLYCLVRELLLAANDAIDTRSARAYLQSFVYENSDLDDD